MRLRNSNIYFGFSYELSRGSTVNRLTWKDNFENILLLRDSYTQRNEQHVVQGYIKSIKAKIKFWYTANKN